MNVKFEISGAAAWASQLRGKTRTLLLTGQGHLIFDSSHKNRVARLQSDEKLFKETAVQSSEKRSYEQMRPRSICFRAMPKVKCGSEEEVSKILSIPAEWNDPGLYEPTGSLIFIDDVTADGSLGKWLQTHWTVLYPPGRQ